VKESIATGTTEKSLVLGKMVSSKKKEGPIEKGGTVCRVGREGCRERQR